MFSRKYRNTIIKKDRPQNGIVEFGLAQNVPNPLIISTTIGLSVARAGMIKLIVYNLQEDPVATLYRGKLSAGYYSLNWDGRDNAGTPLKPGDYVYRLEAAGFVASRKLVIANN